MSSLFRELVEMGGWRSSLVSDSENKFLEAGANLDPQMESPAVQQSPKVRTLSQGFVMMFRELQTLNK